MNIFNCFRYTILSSAIVCSSIFLTLSILAFINLQIPPLYKDLIITGGAAQFALSCSCGFFMLKYSRERAIVKRTLSEERQRIASEFVDAEEIDCWRNVSI